MKVDKSEKWLLTNFCFPFKDQDAGWSETQAARDRCNFHHCVHFERNS